MLQTPSSSEASSSKHQQPLRGSARGEDEAQGTEAMAFKEGAGSSKIQAPRSTEAPSSKNQSRADESMPWWDEEPVGENALVLKDEPSKPLPDQHPFDLEERTAVFGERIVRFTKTVPRSPTNDRLIDQLVGCGTSVGANYCEANEGVSKKDFRHPISRCIKEAKEVKFFLRMIVTAEPQLASEARVLYREANELMLIFARIYRKSTGNV